MNLRRRSGLRSNKKRLVNTVQEDSKKLKAIPEVEEILKDMSSSEKPILNMKLINETILEERSDLHESFLNN